MISNTFKFGFALLILSTLSCSGKNFRCVDPPQITEDTPENAFQLLFENDTLFVSASKLITPNNDGINEAFQLRIGNIETLEPYNTDGSYTISNKCDQVFRSQVLTEEWEAEVEAEGVYNGNIEFTSQNQIVSIDFTFEIQYNLIPQ